MHNSDKREIPLLHRLVNIGLDKEFSIAEIRYLRLNHIAAILGALYMLTWMIIAINLTIAPAAYGSNGLLGLMFLLVLLYNGKGSRVPAST